MDTLEYLCYIHSIYKSIHSFLDEKLHPEIIISCFYYYNVFIITWEVSEMTYFTAKILLSPFVCPFQNILLYSFCFESSLQGLIY